MRIQPQLGLHDQRQRVMAATDVHRPRRDQDRQTLRHGRSDRWRGHGSPATITMHPAAPAPRRPPGHIRHPHSRLRLSATIRAFTSSGQCRLPRRRASTTSHRPTNPSPPSAIPASICLRRPSGRRETLQKCVKSMGRGRRLLQAMFFMPILALARARPMVRTRGPPMSLACAISADR